MDDVQPNSTDPIDQQQQTATLHADSDITYDSDDQCDCDCDCACELGNTYTRTSLPLTYYLELTAECNNRCPGCGNIFIKQTDARLPIRQLQSLDAAAWIAILDQIAGHARRLKLTGGEPTMHPEFEIILQAVAAKQIPFTLFTNGRWRDPAYLVRSLSSIQGCLGLLISLHGATAEAHEAFSGVVGSFAETCENIRRATSAHLQVAISTVFTPQSVNQLDEVVVLARDLGARQVVFNRYIGRPILPIALPDAELNTAVQAVEKLRTAGAPVKFGSCIPACFASSSSKGCSAGTTFATIDPWGYVKPCNHAPVILGNLREDTIEAIWNAPTVDQWAALLPKQCSICSLLHLCHGGCRATALLQGRRKDPLIGRPFTAARETINLATFGQVI